VITTTKFKLLSTLFCLSFISLCYKPLAQGDLLLYPKRIVFEGSQKSQTLNLANSGRDTVRYIISVVQNRMKEDGAFETITQPDSGQNFADKYFRFFPRSVVLGPNEAQTVKIQLVNTGQLASGEYRSHIYFRSEADKKPLGEEKKDTSTAAISVNLVAVFGISIPVIIRVGTPNTILHLSDPMIKWDKDTKPGLQVVFNREGNMSAYGDVMVEHISEDGTSTQVAMVKGMAVYTPNAKRRVNIALANDKTVNYHKGKLHITYTALANGKTGNLLAETELALH
jgi:hypothetical protein